MPYTLPSLAEALRQWAMDTPEPDRVSLARALTDPPDPWRLLPYLVGLGCEVTTLDALFASIENLDGEDDLFAIRVAEGVAVNQPSDGRWLLFTP